MSDKANKQIDKQGSISFSNTGLLTVTVFVAGHLVDPRGKNAQRRGRGGRGGRGAAFPGERRWGRRCRHRTLTYGPVSSQEEELQVPQLPAAPHVLSFHVSWGDDLARLFLAGVCENQPGLEHSC